MSIYDDSIFVNESVIERQVKLGDGSEKTMYFKTINSLDFRKYQIAESSEDEEVRALAISRLISISLCEPDGKFAIPVKKAATLKPQVTNAMVSVILEINGYGTAQKNA